MTVNELPDNDKDLELARQIGSALRGEVDLSSVSDSLLGGLIGYKEVRTSIADSGKAIDSEVLWSRIAFKTKLHENKGDSGIYTLFSKHKAIWATAASVLIMALAGIFYYSSQPTLIAGSGQQIANVILSDGSKVTLRPNSNIYALSKNSEEFKYRLEGEGYFVVKKNTGRIFSVEAGSGKVSILGTRFNLSSWGGQTQVYLEEGKITFKNLKTDSSVKLNPGQSAQIGSDALLSTASSVDPTEFIDWMSRELIFKNKSARYVFNEMGQEFNITIMAPDSIMNTVLSGGLPLQNRDQSLQDLALVLNGEFKKVNQNTYKFVPKR